MNEEPETEINETVGPYILHRQIARGGMATIHVARLLGDEGFSRIVAAKRMLPQFAEDAEFVSMFIDEAKIASKVHHQNVVPVLDVVTTGSEVILVQEYVHGVPLNWLLGAAREGGIQVPIAIVVSVASQILTGLHAAHETVGPGGNPLHIVHRDVSPGNVIVSVDGTALLLDFGVAKATMAAHITRAGTFKGKRTYSSPEQLKGAATRQSDIYSLAVVLWELLVGQRLHPAKQAEQEMIDQIMTGTLPTVTEALGEKREQFDDGRWLQLRTIDPIVRKGLAVALADRYQTAAEMNEALVAIVSPASTGEVAAWVKSLGKEFLEARERVLAQEEAGWRGSKISTSMRPRSPAELLHARASATVSHPMSELRTIPVPDDAPQPAVRRTNRTIALLASLVVLLSIVIVLAARRTSNDPGPEVAPPALGSAERVAPVQDIRTVAPTVAPTVDVAIDPPAPTVDAGPPSSVEPSAAPDETAEGTAPSDPPEPARPPKPVAKPPTTRIRSKSGTVRQESSKSSKSSKSPTKPETKRPNCNPPYYFKATKKIFKPACL